MTDMPGAPDVMTEAGLLEIYGDAEGLFGTMRVPLTAAVQMEAAFCRPGDAEAAQDPERRVRYLARRLAAAGTLREEHTHLLAETAE